MIDIPEIKIEQENVLKIDFKGMLRDTFIDINAPIPIQPVAISIGSSTYKQNIYPIPFGSYGDYSCIIGASKVGKTFFKSAIISGYIGGQSQEYFSNIVGHDNKGKWILDIDTEQSKFHTQRAARRIPEMVGNSYDFYKPFSLREYTANERFQFVDYLINESEYKDNIGLVVIDGYADLVSDFNSLEQSNKLQEKLLQWTTTANCHITGVLHKNFGSSKPVGHVGSSTLKKAETNAFLELEDDIIKVECEYGRNIRFEAFAFRIDEDWLPKEITI